MRSIVKIGVPLLAASLVLTACGSRSDDKGSSTSGGTKTATIGVIAPLTGDLSPLGLGIQHSVELAIKQANATNAAHPTSEGPIMTPTPQRAMAEPRCSTG